MKINRLIISSKTEFTKIKEIGIVPDLIFAFGNRELLVDSEFEYKIKEYFPNTILFGCSSAGEISGLEVVDNSIVLTAVKFSRSSVKMESISVDQVEDSQSSDVVLLNQLAQQGLKHVMLLLDGLNINGAELVRNFENNLPKGVTVTGGLAGDGTGFKETVVFDKDGKARTNCIAALGFYGDNLLIGYGSEGGWDSFGLERLVTKSKENILYELDGQPALQLYKSFLGDRAKDLPASGLLFPLGLREGGVKEPVMRTILGVNEEDQSLIFTGDIPEGAYVKLMKASVDKLINGAEASAIATTKMLPKGDAELVILISCVGRKLVMKQLIEEEIEAVADIIGEQVNITGFYSYGEISPFRQGTPCLLHNQTITITTISEK